MKRRFTFGSGATNPDISNLGLPGLEVCNWLVVDLQQAFEGSLKELYKRDNVESGDVEDHAADADYHTLRYLLCHPSSSFYVMLYCSYI